MDSAQDICGAIQDVLAAHGRTDVSDARFLRRYIGRHLLDMFLDLGFDAGPIDPMIAALPPDLSRRASTRSTACIRASPEMLARAGRTQVDRHHQGHAHDARRAGAVRIDSSISITCRAPTVFPPSRSRT